MLHWRRGIQIFTAVCFVHFPPSTMSLLKSGKSLHHLFGIMRETPPSSKHIIKNLHIN